MSRLARIVLLTATACALAACGGGSDPGSDAGAAEPVTITETLEAPAETGAADTGATPGPADNGDLVLQYVPVEDLDLQAYEDFAAESALLDDSVTAINETIALPQDVVVSVETIPDDPSPFYTPEVPAIVVPIEWLVFSDQLLSESDLGTAEEIEALILASTAFVFYHELGHLLVDQLGLPITGREEDAVDQLATVIVTQAGADAGNIALAGAIFFGLLGANRSEFEAADFWDVHSLNEQRFFNIVCWVYGSDPQAFADIPAQAGIGEDRLASCEDEYQQILTSWETLLGPYLK